MSNFRLFLPLAIVASVSGVQAQRFPPASPEGRAEKSVEALLSRLGTPEAAYHAALLKDPPAASLTEAEVILARAAAGDARAQFAVWSLGIESGDKPPSDYLRDAAAQNDPDAVREVARLAYPKNPDETVRLLAPLAEKGEPDSCYRLGVIRLLRAKTPDETRAAIRLLETAYGAGTSPNGDSAYRHRGDLAPILGAAWCELSDATPGEIAAALESYGRNLPPGLRLRLQQRSGKADEATSIRSLKEKFSQGNVGARGPRTPFMKRNPHLLALAEALPDAEKPMVAHAYALRFGDYSYTPEELAVMIRLLLPVAQQGEAWAQAAVARIAREELAKLPEELRVRIAEIKTAPVGGAKKPSKYVLLFTLGRDMATNSGRLRMPGSPPVIQKFSDIHTDLALLDNLPEATLIASLDDLATKGDRTAVLCRALVVSKTDPRYAEARNTLMSLAVAGNTAACMAVATDEKDPAARLALLEKAAKDDNDFAIERLALELETQTPADFRRAIAVASRINPERNPFGLNVAIRMIRDHRELYTSEAEYRSALATLQQRIQKVVSARIRMRPPGGNELNSFNGFNGMTENEVKARSLAANKATDDERRSVEDWLTAKSEAGSIDAALVLGDYLLASTSSKTGAALRQLRHAAKLGSAEAALRLGTDYHFHSLLTTDERLAYLRQAASGGFVTAYGPIAGLERSREQAGEKERAAAANEALEAGYAAGDFYCAMTLASSRRSGPRTSDLAKRAEGLLAAEKILLSAKPADNDDRNWLKHALIELYLDERFPKDGKPLEKISAIAPEAFTATPVTADKKTALSPYGNSDAPLEYWHKKLRTRALVFAQAQGSPDAAYLLFRDYENVDVGTSGKSRNEWLRIAADAGHPAAIVTLANSIESFDAGRKNQNSERDELIKKLSPLAEKDPAAANTLSTLYFASGRKAESVAALRQAAILGDEEAMGRCVMIHLLAANAADPRYPRLLTELGIRPDLNEGHAWFVILAERRTKRESHTGESSAQQLTNIEKQPGYDERKAKLAETAIREAMKRACDRADSSDQD